jgi:hypothetical protein
LVFVSGRHCISTSCTPTLRWSQASVSPSLTYAGCCREADFGRLGLGRRVRKLPSLGLLPGRQLRATIIWTGALCRALAQGDVRASVLGVARVTGRHRRHRTPTRSCRKPWHRRARSCGEVARGLISGVQLPMLDRGDLQGATSDAVPCFHCICLLRIVGMPRA